jgi:hypothetical protein
MSGRRLKVRARMDFIARLAQAPMMTSIEELIWNAFDERAKTVSIALTSNGLDGIEKIEIRDDGSSLKFENAPEAFENLGSSNKVGRTLETGEPLHGRKGEGRHKALSLGNKVVWRFVYDKSGQPYTYDVIGTAGREDPFFLTDEKSGSKESVGCAVIISDIHRSLNQLLQPDARREVTSVFAPFLIRHPDRRLIYQGKPIRPKDAIKSTARIRPIAVEHEGERYRVTFDIIHWNDGHKRREVQLCSENGIPLHKLTNRPVAGNGEFSVFVSSKLFDVLHEQNLLSSVEMAADGGRKEIIDNVWSKARKYFRDQNQQDSIAELERLRNEGSYPYKGDPKSATDKVERRVFDVCAIKISQNLPNFNEGMNGDGRKLLLRVVREAISQNPSSVGHIIREVCRLPERDAQNFAQLLEDVPLRSVVQLSSMVAARLQFLQLFESAVYLDPFERVIKERTQLQRLLIPNTWLFGEEYALGTDDENLKVVLQKHIEILGRSHLAEEMRDSDIRSCISEFNKTHEKTAQSLSRIPDIMLWRRFEERRAGEYEFLVVEIKRPGVAIGRKEIEQIENYAEAITKTPFADVDRTRWVFVVVSDELDSHAQDRAHQIGLPHYTILAPSQKRYEIQARPWSQLIQSAKARHSHLQKWLDYTVSRDKVLERAVEFTDCLPPLKKPSSAKKPKPKISATRRQRSE